MKAQANYTKEDVKQEDIKIRRLRNLMDFTCLVLYQEHMGMEEALRVIRGAKRIALSMYPDKEETFELIYGSRFRRILVERFSEY